MNPSLYKVIYFPLSTGTVMDFYRGLAFGLGEEPKSRKADLFRQIQQAVQAYFRERKITPVRIRSLLDKMTINRKELKPPEGYEQYPNSLIAWHATLGVLTEEKQLF